MAETHNYTIISLRQVSAKNTVEEENLGLSSGRTYLPNQPEIPFELGWKTTIPRYHHSDLSKIININEINISQVHAVHMLLQGGWIVRTYQNKSIGKIILSFSEGEVIETTLTAGENIRDWSLDKPDAIQTKTSEMLQEVWVGQVENSRERGRIDMLTVDIPGSYQATKLINIQINADVVEQYWDIEPPCIHLLAITAACTSKQCD